MKTVNAILGRNSPVLNFADPLPNPLTDRFTIVNGKQPEISCSFPPITIPPSFALPSLTQGQHRPQGFP